MKWVTLIGRLGMVILMTGLAVGLVSLIPSVQMTPSSSSENAYVPPERYNYLNVYSRLTPQLGLHISVESNSSLSIYLLDVFFAQFQNWTASWVKQQFPNFTTPEIFSASYNVSALNAFLENHSDAVLWKAESVKNVSEEFYPTTTSNATAIIANPSPELAQYTYEITFVTSLAPKAKVVLLSEILIPLGAVLAIPWAYSIRMRKPQLQ